jgi:hypothetical protein
MRVREGKVNARGRQISARGASGTAEGSDEGDGQRHDFGRLGRGQKTDEIGRSRSRVREVYLTLYPKEGSFLSAVGRRGREEVMVPDNADVEGGLGKNGKCRQILCALWE